MTLERAVSVLDGKRLDGVLGHWDFDRQSWPPTEEERRALLLRHLRNPKEVEERVGTMPSRLRELLVYVLRSGICRTPSDLRDLDVSELPLESFEVVPVAMALAERGFLVMSESRSTGKRVQKFRMPDETAELLEHVLEGTAKPIDAALGLGSWLRFVGRGVWGPSLEAMGRADLIQSTPADLVKHLVSRESYEDRRLRLPSAFSEEIRKVEEHGGVLDVDARRRLGLELDEETLEDWGRSLEKNLLGTLERSELTNFGLSCRDAWLVVFHEIVDARLDELDASIQPDDAESVLRRAPEPLGDIQAVVDALEETPFKLKKNGEYPKTGLKRLVRQALTRGSRRPGADEDLLWLLQFLQSVELIQPGIDGRVRPTRLWKDFVVAGSFEKSRRLLDGVMRLPAKGFSPLHHRALRRGFMEALKEHPRKWRSLPALVMKARNRVLREALRPEQAQRYQDRHKHAPFPPLATPDALQKALYEWITEDLLRTGLVELAWNDGDARPFALRISRLGAQVMGIEVEGEDEEPSGVALIVNPDHEVIIFPEQAPPHLPQEVGRFAVRQKADYALHYVLTKESVQSAAARGLTAEEMLTTLEEASPHELPENVAYSMREWCRKLVRLQARRSWLIEAEDPKSLDRALKVPELKSLVVNRPTPHLVELSEDPAAAGVIPLLRDEGIYL